MTNWLPKVTNLDLKNFKCAFCDLRVEETFKTTIQIQDGEILSWQFPGSVKVRVMVDNSKDVLPNIKKHPRGGLYSSRIFDVLSIGTSAQPNIQIVKVKDTPEVFTYIPGMRSPFNPTGKLDSNSPIQVASPID